MNSFICPVCRKELVKSQQIYRCSNKHTFDIAKSGYVNLLLSNQMNAKLPGDNKLMVHARQSFLNKGYYSVLSDGLCEAIRDCVKQNAFILDAGCGEGYYTTNVNNHLIANNLAPKTVGIDISKNALALASKKCKEIEYATASLFHMPIANRKCDVLMTLFAPFCGEEFKRVVKKDGYMIMVIPGEKHLLGLKRVAYDNTYLNEVREYTLDGFSLKNKINIHDNISLECNQDIQNLFTMTPYYYKTSIEGSKRISELESLTTEIEFEILVYSIV